jgi:hypothetical protein
VNVNPFRHSHDISMKFLLVYAHLSKSEVTDEWFTFCYCGNNRETNWPETGFISSIQLKYAGMHRKKPLRIKLFQKYSHSLSFRSE